MEQTNDTNPTTHKITTNKHNTTLTQQLNYKSQSINKTHETITEH